MDFFIGFDNILAVMYVKCTFVINCNYYQALIALIIIRQFHVTIARYHFPINFVCFIEICISNQYFRLVSKLTLIKIHFPTVTKNATHVLVIPLILSVQNTQEP